METVINLGEIKEANAPEVKIDELTSKIKALSTLKDSGNRASMMLYMDGDTKKGEMHVDLRQANSCNARVNNQKQRQNAKRDGGNAVRIRA